jgi:hypothetical protein
MLASFLGVLPILTPPLCALAFNYLKMLRFVHFLKCSQNSLFILSLIQQLFTGYLLMGVSLHPKHSALDLLKASLPSKKPSLPPIDQR